MHLIYRNQMYPKFIQIEFSRCEKMKNYRFQYFHPTNNKLFVTLPLKVFIIVNGEIVLQEKKPIFPTGFHILYIIHLRIYFIFVLAESCTSCSIFNSSICGVIEKTSFTHTFDFISRPGVRCKIFTLQSYRAILQKVDRARDRCILYVTTSIKYIFIGT